MRRTADQQMKRRTGVLLAVALLAAGLLLWKYWPQPEPAGATTAGNRRPTNVVLITLDTMRADRLGVYGHATARTPNLDALARAGVRFDDAITVAPITGPAHAAILTGVQPARYGVRDNATTPLPDEALTLAETLSSSGFATGGFIGAFILDRSYGFAQGFDTFESGFTRVDSGTEANTARPRMRSSMTRCGGSPPFPRIVRSSAGCTCTMRTSTTRRRRPSRRTTTARSPSSISRWAASSRPSAREARSTRR